jgi:hypothetical protein
MTDYRDRDRDRDKRPSWREMDRKKDKSKHVRDDRLYKKKQDKVTTGYSRYKDQLDRLFSTGEKSDMVQGVLGRRDGKKILEGGEAPERQKLLRSIREAVSERQLEAAVDEFMKKYGELPDDIVVLTQALLHSDDAVRERALQRISRYLDGHVLENKAVLLERVKYLAVASDDDAVEELSMEVKKKLG